jgi:GNAT superfamily N-acetyltransferase
MESLQIVPLGEKYLGDVVQIHRNVLGYTFNSRLGIDHLSFLYRAMAQDQESYLGVALIRGQPVGMVSGTLDIDKIKTSMLNAYRLKQWGNLLLHVLRRPSLIHEWWKGNVIGRPVYFEEKLIRPILTTIAVDSRYQGKGVGKHMVRALEVFFRQNNVNYYRLDTLAENAGARKFYESLGFQQVELRADSILFVKKMCDE